MNQKKIKVFFIKFNDKNLNKASENRFWALVKMVSYNFKVEIIHLYEVKRPFSKIKFIRGFAWKYKAIKATFQMNKVYSKNDINILYLFGVDPLLSLYYRFFGKCKNILLISERNEYPSSIIKNKKILYLINSLFLYPWYYNLFNGYTIISTNLINHYKKYTNKNCIIQKLPMTVDLSRFNNIKKTTKKKYIFYAGSLNNKKDGIEFLIHSFINISNSIPNVELLIAGNSGKSDLNKIKKQILLSNNNKIRLLGIVDKDKIPQYIVNSSVCVLPRPDSMQARGGFPTKLGEYLASGVPVIVTDVGEIQEYLSDKDVYYISKNNIQKELSSVLLEVFSNYSEAKKIGDSGKKKAIELFSLKNNSVLIKHFINTVVGNNVKKK